MFRDMKLSEITKKMAKAFFTNRITNSAAELAYYLLFSVFSMIMCLTVIFSYITISPETVHQVISIFPPDVQTFILNFSSYVGEIPKIPVLIFGALSMVFLFSRAAASLSYHIRRLYHTENAGISSKLTAKFTVSFVLMFLINLGFILLGRQLTRLFSQYMGPGYNLSLLFQAVRYTIPVACIFFFLLLIYKVMPGVDMYTSDAVPGTIFAMVAWTVVSMILSRYISIASNLTLFYGSMSVIVILLIWLFMTGAVLVYGAQLNAILFTAPLKKRNHPKNSTDSPPPEN